LGALAHVIKESREVIQRLAGAIHVAHTFAVHDKEMILSRAAGDIDVFPELDIAFGAEDSEPAVAPGGQAVRREPVDAVIARSTVAAQKHFPEILELGRL